MEPIRRECPACGQVMDESDGAFICAEHGAWFSYGPVLLVRAPRVEDLSLGHFSMPWEQQAPRSA